MLTKESERVGPIQIKIERDRKRGGEKVGQRERMRDRERAGKKERGEMVEEWGRRETLGERGACFLWRETEPSEHPEGGQPFTPSWALTPVCWKTRA